MDRANKKYFYGCPLANGQDIRVRGKNIYLENVYCVFVFPVITVISWPLLIFKYL